MFIKIIRVYFILLIIILHLFGCAYGEYRVGNTSKTITLGKVEIIGTVYDANIINNNSFSITVELERCCYESGFLGAGRLLRSIVAFKQIPGNSRGNMSYSFYPFGNDIINIGTEGLGAGYFYTLYNNAGIKIAFSRGYAPYMKTRGGLSFYR